VAPRRGDRVAPPPGPGEWDIVFGTNDAAKGWEDLCAQVPNNTYDAWRMMRTGPAPTARTSRHQPLKGVLAAAHHRGRTLPQWQIEVSGSGRIWYLVDTDRRCVVVTYASPQHPKATE
jgi:hypothetical protein